MKKLITMCVVMMSLFQLSACNTMQGFGKDVKKAGEAVENAGKH